MYRVFGDIEHKNKIITQTIIGINDSFKSNRRMIFLGDIFTLAHPSESIADIELLLSLFDIPIIDRFDDDLFPFNVENVKYIWNELYKTKHIDIYNVDYIQFMCASPLKYHKDRYITNDSNNNASNDVCAVNVKSSNDKSYNTYNRFNILSKKYTHQLNQPIIPIINIANQKNKHTHQSPTKTSSKTKTKPNYPLDQLITDNQSLNSINNPSSPIFIFGNKEIGFILQFIKCSRINVNNNKCIVMYHAFNYKNKGSLNVNTYSRHEINVMFAYLSNCRHYFIDNNIMYLHCFMNARMFQSLQFNKIVCGHNKGFGMFRDNKYKDKSIFMIDYTCIDDETLIPNKPYFDINYSRVIMNDDRFFPIIISSCTLISYSEKSIQSLQQQGNIYYTSSINETHNMFNDVDIIHLHDKFHAINDNNKPLLIKCDKLLHMNKYTIYHDSYSDTELLDDKEWDIDNDC